MEASQSLNSIRPIEQSERIAILDILRGWALIGVVLVNYFLFFYLEPNARIASNDIASRVAKILISIFFTNKSRIMLNVLFGYGFSVLINNLRSRGVDPVPFFARRMLWLFVIALLNTCLYYGDFLKDYALIGLVMLLFYRASAKTSLYFALIFLVVYPIAPYLLHGAQGGPPPTDLRLYESHNVASVFRYGVLEGLKDYLAMGKLLGADMFALACFLWGQCLQKLDFFSHVAENKKYIKRAFWTGLVAAI